MSKQQKKKSKRRFTTTIHTRLVVIKSSWTTSTDESHQDFQLLQVNKSMPLAEIVETVQRQAEEKHPEMTWQIEVFDVNDMPPGTIPEGTTFALGSIFNE
ncbi:MAG TPA: hypothetical protein VKR06_40440 [Ktedonosporobacter sp.]|nr:hypothetical protein [Ktedonosporobacter sp.]